MVTLIPGKKYRLEHGVGTYIGYEHYDNLYRTDETHSIIKESPPEGNDERRIFDLDEGHTWAFTDQLYATWDSDIKELP